LQRREVLTEMGVCVYVEASQMVEGCVLWQFVWEKRRESERVGGGSLRSYFTMGG
jgi:hypothetical protein